MLDIITRKGWLNSIAQTNEHPQFGTAYALVKNYANWGVGTVNLEIVVRRPDGDQRLVYVFADSAGWPYEPGVPIVVLNADARYPEYDQIDGKPGPSSCGWRVNGTLEVTANLRCVKGGRERQAWVRVVLREVGGVWREV